MFTVQRGHDNINIHLNRVPNTYVIGAELLKLISGSVNLNCKVINETYKNSNLFIVKTDQEIERYLTSYINRMSDPTTPRNQLVPNSFSFNYAYNRVPQDSEWLPMTRFFLEGHPNLINQIIKEYNLQIDQNLIDLCDNKSLLSYFVYLPYNPDYDVIKLIDKLSKLYKEEPEFFIEPEFLVTIKHC